jgi:plasmid stabilization system protein ParE
MKYELRFDERAIEEAQEAYEYYENQQVGLGDRFKNEIDKCISYIRKNPNQFKKVKKEIREALLHKFPYLIVYKVIDEKIIVAAIFHTSRDPKEKIRK